MEKAKKNLKVFSILVLVFAGCDFIKSIVEVLFFAKIPPVGTTPAIWIASKIVFVVLAVLVLIPQIFVGVRGIKMANGTVTKKGHITWASILCIIVSLGIIIIGINAIWPEVFKVSTTAARTTVSLSLLIAENLVYLEYIRNAKLIAKEA